MRVTAPTQNRFEELYFILSENYTEYGLSDKIARILEKNLMAVYMYFRQCFTGGSEAKKRQLITAMEKIAGELKCN